MKIVANCFRTSDRNNILDVLTKDIDISVNRKVIDFDEIQVIKRVVDIQLKYTNFEYGRDLDGFAGLRKGCHCRVIVG
jgi:hypothetical protein